MASGPFSIPPFKNVPSYGSAKQICEFSASSL